jgi:hypothetical protein
LRQGKHEFPQGNAKKREEPSMPENNFQAKVRKEALANGRLYYHTHDSRRSDPDFPDTVIAWPGNLFFWELKVGKNKPTQGQLNWVSILNTVSGVHAAVYYPSDWPKMLEILRGRPHEY